MSNPIGYTALINSFYTDNVLYNYWDIYTARPLVRSLAKYKDYIDVAVLYE